MPNPSGKNGNKPGPPDEDLRPILEKYAARGFTNPQIHDLLVKKHFNPDFYALSVELIKKRRQKWQIPSTRAQRHTMATAGPYIEDIRSRYPSVGYRVMKNLLRHELGQFVSKTLIRQYMNAMHPDEVRARKAKRLVRKVYWTAGVNDIWSMDQHDKWRKYQLFLHIGVETFSGAILWLKVWWTNRNPRLVCNFYLDTIENRDNVMALLTQSDPGTENYGIANAQTILRHRQEPSLAESLQHQFRGNKGNIKPEIAWRRLRYCWTPGYERTIQEGITAGLYDPDVILEWLCFHYVFIPWIQTGLDEYVELTNDSTPRYNRHKVTPHGRPIEILNSPEDYCTKDFGIKVQQQHLNEVRARFAPTDDPVFHLVPPSFAVRAEAFYAAAGHPPAATHANVWGIYQRLLDHFIALDQEPDIMTMVNEQEALPAVGEDAQGAEHMDLLPLKRYRAPRLGLPEVGGAFTELDEELSDEVDMGYNYWTSSESASDSENGD